MILVGLGMLKRFLHLLPPGAGIKEREKLEQWPPEFQVDELFDVPGVGTVVGGENAKRKSFFYQDLSHLKSLTQKLTILLCWVICHHFIKLLSLQPL